MLTSEEKSPPLSVLETVPEGPVEPERSFLADPTEEKSGSTFIDAGQTNIVDESSEGFVSEGSSVEIGIEDNIFASDLSESLLSDIEEIKSFESRLSADPSLDPEDIEQALLASFEPEGDRIVPVTDNPLDLPFGRLLTEALGRARSQEELDRIKNSFYSGVGNILPDGHPLSRFRNQINASIDVYFSNLKPYVDYDEENEFERVVEEDIYENPEESQGIPGLRVVKREPREVKDEPSEGEEEESEGEEEEKSETRYQEVLLTPDISEVEEDFYDTDDEDWEPESYLDIGSTIEDALEGDVLRLYQAEEVDDGKHDAINFYQAYDDTLDQFRSDLQSEARERPLDEKDEKEIKMVISEVPNFSLREELLAQYEEIKDAQRYEREELEDLPPHILEPLSMKARYPGLPWKRNVLRGYKKRGPTGVVGLDPGELELAEQKMYTRSAQLTDTGKTVWIGPRGGEYMYNARTKKFASARPAPKMPGSLEGDLVEYYRDSPKEIKAKTRALTQQDIDTLFKTTSKNLRPNQSKKLGQIQIQWTTGQNQRDIIVPSTAQFEDVVKLSEILRVEEGRLLDLEARELLGIKKDTPLSGIISFFQSMLAANAGHDLHLVFLPGKGRGSGLYLGGAMMSVFKPPLVPHKEYHTTPGSRYKEYLSRLPLSSFSRHHRNPGGAIRTGGRPHGAPPGHGWNDRVPKTIQPYEFANVGAFPLPQRSFWDSDALDRDPKALATPFGSLPPGLGGPYGFSQEGIGGNIAARVQGWRVTPRGKGKRGGAKVSDVATGIAGVSGALAASGIGAVAAAPIAAVSGIVAGLGKIFGF